MRKSQATGETGFAVGPEGQVDVASREIEDLVDAPQDSNGDAPTEATEATPAPAATPKVKRGTLPEGYITPVQFAKVLTKAELHTDKKGSHEVPPQMVYSLINNSPKENPFPIQTVTDSNGLERKVLVEAEGLAWWAAKNERTAARKANAAAKAAAPKPAAKPKAEAAVEGDENVEAPEEFVGEVVEAE
jgi:hypothetical protein